MDSSGLRTLNFVSPFHFRSRAYFIYPLLFAEVRKKRYISLSSSPRLTRHRCSLAVRNGVSSLPESSGQAVGEVSRDRLLQVVLVSPQIPGNTGCIARTCAASAVGLHLVGPLGFHVDDTKLKRAGLDYWPYVVVKVHGSWAEFKDYFRQQDGEKRLLAFTKRGTTIHSDFSYKRGDWLVFGSETSGLAPEVLLDCKNETFGGGTIRIPMVETYVRCLNLSVSVGIALYEASRQLNYEHLQSTSEPCIDNLKSFIAEDIFA
ncbi:putative tRNA (cytidine(34)-2'-O)-methyltransferase [Telopea speciosissima]|uniref:putative tRNA (cytidine(34)-2'-O)-methyltransferase n=1 Tax=Telopea speciosissima TaxID=54955 RepID=UPI001CC79983|nr:putative tRNA (cytidine(34)-2'-O)-methyltransferase [Telopea speciosissima]